MPHHLVAPFGLRGSSSALMRSPNAAMTRGVRAAEDGSATAAGSGTTSAAAAASAEETGPRERGARGATGRAVVCMDDAPCCSPALEQHIRDVGGGGGAPAGGPVARAPPAPPRSWAVTAAGEPPVPSSTILFWWPYEGWQLGRVRRRTELHGPVRVTGPGRPRRG